MQRDSIIIDSSVSYEQQETELVLKDLYGAMSKFQSQDPEQFDNILASSGGGMLRWAAWRSKLFDKISSKKKIYL